MELEKEKLKVLVFAGTILLLWLLVPLIGQYFYDYSAIKLSFGITALYYVGFQLWKRFIKEEEDNRG